MDYASLDAGRGGYTHADFPTAHFPGVADLIFLRSWTAEALVKLAYYIAVFFITCVFSIVVLVNTTRLDGVGGFFYGLLLDCILVPLGVLSTRVAAEVVLSVFSIRDNIYFSGVAASSKAQGVGAGAPPMASYQAPAFNPAPAAAGGGGGGGAGEESTSYQSL